MRVNAAWFALTMCASFLGASGAALVRTWLDNRYGPHRKS